MDANGIIFRTIFLTSIISCAATPTHATLIDFDSLVQAPCTEESCDPTVVDNQYAGLGVTFGGAGLYSYSPAPQIVSQSNAISDFYGPSLQINFSGNLPTTVRVYVSAINQDSVFLTAYGNNGAVDSAVTDGWRGTEETSTPYRDQQLITLSSHGGISQVNLETVFMRRGTLIIDNLEFGNDISVPLPTSAGFLASALCGLWLSSRRNRRE